MSLRFALPRAVCAQSASVLKHVRSAALDLRPRLRPATLLLGAASVLALTMAPATTFARSERSARRDVADNRDAQRAERRAEKEAAEKAANAVHPLTIVVSTRHQHIKVYSSSGRVISEAPVSTGQSGHETPQGVFSIIGKEQMHHSNLYNDAPMPWMERITWSGVALHAGHLPGYPASHGCIRLPHAYSRALYGLTRMGTRVIVASDDPTPRSIEHEDLFQPLPTAAQVAARQQVVAQATVGASLLGITPANAAEMARAPRTREQAASEREGRLANAKSLIQESESKRSAAEAASIAASNASGDAQLALRAARQDEARQRQDVETARRQIEVTRRELVAFGRVAHKVDEASEEQVAKALEAEQRLEDRLQALETEVEAGSTALAGKRAAVEAAEREAATAQAKRVADLYALRQANQTLDEAREALRALERAEANRDRPIAVLVSRKTGKLYVRQGFEPMFEAAVTIESPELPIGTHVFTAVGDAAQDGGLNWSVVSVQSGAAANDNAARRKSRRGKDVVDDDPPDAQTVAHASSAMSALDRISMAPETRERIAEFIKTGSSLIVSDYGPSNETGRGTEFVVLTR